jgi:hypothetical protein
MLRGTKARAKLKVSRLSETLDAAKGALPLPHALFAFGVGALRQFH